MPAPRVAALLGGLTGILTLIAMLRLVAGAFEDGISPLGWAFTLLALVPWIAYVAGRARHGSLTRRAGLTVVGLDGVGLVVVWLSTAGPVLALALAFAAFVVIWVHDRALRPIRGETTYVTIDELRRDPGDEVDDEPDAARDQSRG